jgi:hypothetical protein
MNGSIFVSLASYLDPMLFFTLNDAVSKAARPELLTFGVVDQHIVDQRAAIRALPFASQVRYVHLHPQDTLGVSWARNIAFSLHNDEEFLLQVDSHMCFEQGWDDILRQQHASLCERSPKPIITTYPYRFDMVDGVPHFTPPEGKTALVLRPHPATTLSDNDVVLRFMGKHLFTDEPVEGCHLAAGFIFCSAAFIEEVPYDPFLYFHGEEQSLAVRAYTRGWTIYHPTWVPLYHLYKQENVAHDTHHWHGAVDANRAFNGAYLTERARLRLFELLCGSGLKGAYGLGNERSLDDFIAMSGIDYRNKTISERYEGRLV